MQKPLIISASSKTMEPVRTMTERVSSESDQQICTVHPCSDTPKESSSEMIIGTGSSLGDEVPYSGCSMDELDTENIVIQEGSEELDTDEHAVKLGKVCRICGEMKVKYDGPKKGIPKKDVVKHVKKIWNIDISDESPEVYPVNVCVSCERKIKRLYLKISKRKKCELYRARPAEFIEHSEKDCHVCQLEEKIEVLPSCTPTLALSEQENGGVCDDERKMNTPCLTSHESCRNSPRKKCLERRETSFVSVSSQTGSFHGRANITGLEEHDYTQDECLDIPKKQGGRMPYHKLALSSVTAKYIRQDRLKPLIAHIDKFCEVQKEDKTEVLFFLLVQSLRDTGDRVREGLVTDIWFHRDSSNTSLTEEECLAKRILLKQTKDQYRKEYSYYKEKLNKCVLKPPCLLDRLEKTFFPENLEYWVTEGDGGHIIHQHSKGVGPSFLSIPQSNGCRQGEEAQRGVLGVRWHYPDALAKTLEELWGTLEREVEVDMYLQAEVEDYWEERRDASAYAEKTDSSGRTIQSKLVNYMFGVLTLQMVIKDKVTSVYKVDPNVALYRPLMKAHLGEGGTLEPSLSAIEVERTSLLDKVVHIRLPNAAILRVVISFASPVVKARKDYRLVLFFSRLVFPYSILHSLDVTHAIIPKTILYMTVQFCSLVKIVILPLNSPRNLGGLNLWSLRKIPAILSRYGSICLDLKRSWLASSPRLISVCTVVSAKIKCSRCGHQGHNVRR